MSEEGKAKISAPMGDFYRGYTIQIEQVGPNLYAFVWRPGSRIESGGDAVTARDEEGLAILLARAHARIDADLAEHRARAVPSEPGVRLRN